MKNLSVEEKQKYHAEKKARIQEIRKVLSELTDEQRQEMIERLGIVVTIEGHPLTPYNTCFLYSQTEIPVTVVGGYQQWRKAGRTVKKGEKSLLIFVPSKTGETKEDANASEEDIFFFTAAVFDVSQTAQVEETKEQLK